MISTILLCCIPNNDHLIFILLKIMIILFGRKAMFYLVFINEKPKVIQIKIKTDSKHGGTEEKRMS